MIFLAIIFKTAFGHWDRHARDVVNDPSLTVLKRSLVNALNNLL